MAPLRGMSGLYLPDPQSTTQTMDEGVLEAKANPTNPEHGEYGSQSLGYSGIDPTANPYGPFSAYEGWQQNLDYSGMDYQLAGIPHDDVPATLHSAPWPRGIPQQSWDTPNDLALAGAQLQIMHGDNSGGVEFNVINSPGGREEETHYTTDRYDAPNDNYLSPEVPGQLRGTGFNNGVGASGHGNADTTQGYGVLNSLEEFQMGHSIRRVQHDRMPWDFSNTHGEQDVPFPARHPVQQMPLNGPDSPYYEMGDISGAQIPWEGRIGDPTAYTQPSEVTVLPASSDPTGDVYAWG